MKKDRLDDLADSLKQMWEALLVFEAAANDRRQSAYAMCQMEAEKNRYQDRADKEAVALEAQNACLMRLGISIADGAVLQRGNGEIEDCGFYLFAKDGNSISVANTIQELIANIPKGE